MPAESTLRGAIDAAALRVAQTKASTLVEALPWLERFRGALVVIKYGGAAMTDPELREDFARDVVLLNAWSALPAARARSTALAAITCPAGSITAAMIPACPTPTRTVRVSKNASGSTSAPAAPTGVPSRRATSRSARSRVSVISIASATAASSAALACANQRWCG